MVDSSKISLRHAIDLLYAGPDIVRKMGHERALQDRLPALRRTFQHLVAQLDELGCNGLQVLFSDPRLATALFHALGCDAIPSSIRNFLGLTRRRPKRRSPLLEGETQAPAPEPPAIDLTDEELVCMAATLDGIVSELNELGCNGLAILRRDARLAGVLNEYWTWKKVLESQDDSPEELEWRDLFFTIDTVPIRKLCRNLAKGVRRLCDPQQQMWLKLKDGQLWVECHPMSFALPARYDFGGQASAHIGFLKLFFCCVQRDEQLECSVTSEKCTINQFSFYEPDWAD